MFISPVRIGPPESLIGREPEEQRVYTLLQDLNIVYEMVDHDEAATMEDCKAIGSALGTDVVKNLVLCNRQKTNFYLLLTEGDKIFKTKYLSAQIGSARLSFAAPEDMTELLGVRPGSATVLALMNDDAGRVQLLIDQCLLGKDTIGCHPCRCTSTLKLRTKDIYSIFLPAVSHTFRVVDLPEEPR